MTLDELTEREYTRMTDTRESYKTAIVLADEHIPFMNYDLKNAVVDVLEEEQPDYRIHLGDLIDNPAMSDFDQDPHYNRTTQDEIDEAVRYLNELYEASPDTKTVVLPGNHDVARLERVKSLSTKGLKDLRALSYQNLIKESARAQDLEIGDVEFVNERYDAHYVLGGDKGIYFTHGDPRMNSNILGGKTGFRRTAESHPFPGDVVYGHQHQAKEAKNRKKFEGYGDRSVYVVAAMMDTDDKHYVTNSDYENGFMFVHYNPMVRPAPAKHFQNIRLASNGSFVLNGKEYNSRRTHR